MSDLKKQAFALYKPPFRHEHGYIFDSGNNMVSDSYETSIARVRGWGRISYMDAPEKLQDQVGEMIAEALTQYWTPSKGVIQNEKEYQDAITLCNTFADVIGDNEKHPLFPLMNALMEEIGDYEDKHVKLDPLQELTEQAQELDMGYGPNACPVCGKSNCKEHV